MTPPPPYDWPIIGCGTPALLLVVCCCGDCCIERSGDWSGLRPAGVFRGTLEKILCEQSVYRTHNLLAGKRNRTLHGAQRTGQQRRLLRRRRARLRSTKVRTIADAHRRTVGRGGRCLQHRLVLLLLLQLQLPVGTLAHGTHRIRGRRRRGRRRARPIRQRRLLNGARQLRQHLVLGLRALAERAQLRELPLGERPDALVGGLDFALHRIAAATRQQRMPLQIAGRTDDAATDAVEALSAGAGAVRLAARSGGGGLVPVQAGALVEQQTECGRVVGGGLLGFDVLVVGL